MKTLMLSLTLFTTETSLLALHQDFEAKLRAISQIESGDNDKAKGRNDYFDCTVYALALREMLKLRTEMRRPVQSQHTRAETRQPQSPSLPGWYQNRR